MSKKSRIKNREAKREKLRLEEEKRQERREFLKKFAFIGVGCAVSALGVGGAAKFSYDYLSTSPFSVYERGYNLDLSIKPDHLFEDTRKNIELTDKYRETMVKQILSDPILRGKDLKQYYDMDTQSVEYVKFEKDLDYAKKIIGLSKRSIDHMLDFFQSEHFKSTTIRFEVPQKPSDIENINTEGILFYIFRDFGDYIGAKFVFNDDGKKLHAESWFTDSGYGKEERNFNCIRMQVGYKCKELSNKPIFYNISLEESSDHGLVNLIETPPIEVLHKMISPITYVHLTEDLSRLVSAKYKALDVLSKYHNTKEERFVHALSIIWWDKFFNDKVSKIKKFFLDDELSQFQNVMKDRFSEYEDSIKGVYTYKGANKLSEHIQKIGIQTAIDQYVNDPDKLFSVIDFDKASFEKKYKSYLR